VSNLPFGLILPLAGWTPALLPLCCIRVRYFFPKNVLYSLERYGIDDSSQPIGLRGMPRSAPIPRAGRALPPLPARIGRQHSERA
jgi:hypothetical protein